MSENSAFLVSLTRIPYFASLASQHGDQWLREVFDTLETSDYDFSRFESLKREENVLEPPTDDLRGEPDEHPASATVADDPVPVGRIIAEVPVDDLGSVSEDVLQDNPFNLAASSLADLFVFVETVEKSAHMPVLSTQKAEEPAVHNETNTRKRRAKRAR